MTDMHHKQIQMIEDLKTELAAKQAQLTRRQESLEAAVAAVTARPLRTVWDVTAHRTRRSAGGDQFGSEPGEHESEHFYIVEDDDLDMQMRAIGEYYALVHKLRVDVGKIDVEIEDGRATLMLKEQHLKGKNWPPTQWYVRAIAMPMLEGVADHAASN